jgi:DNA-binding NtrC family response regulator
MAHTSPKPETISSGSDWVMMVDDEFDIISIFKQALMNKGFHIFGFIDPLLALEHFQINFKRYELVISDLRMPGMNGYELVKKINEIKPQIKIFIMTAFEINDVEFKHLLPEVKIEDVLQKPISLAELTSTVRKHIHSPP